MLLTCSKTKAGVLDWKQEDILMNMLQFKPTISTNWTSSIHLKQKQWAKIAMALRWTLYKWNRLPHCEQHTVTLPVHKEAIKFFSRVNRLLLLDFQTNSKNILTFSINYITIWVGDYVSTQNRFSKKSREISWTVEDSGFSGHAWMATRCSQCEPHLLLPFTIHLLFYSPLTIF